MKYETLQAVCSASFQYWLCRHPGGRLAMERPPLPAPLELLPEDPQESRRRLAALRRVMGRVQLQVMTVLRYEDGSICLRSGGQLLGSAREVPPPGRYHAAPVLGLPQDQLRDIVGRLQSFLYVDGGGTHWDPDREVNGGDLVEFVTGLLREHGLEPRPVLGDQDLSHAWAAYHRARPGEVLP